MSDIARLYTAVRAVVPACEYVRVASWAARTTWEAHARDGHTFTEAERAAIGKVFDEFVLSDHGDVGARGHPDEEDDGPAFRQAAKPAAESQAP